MTWAANFLGSNVTVFLRPTDFRELWNCRGPLIWGSYAKVCLRPTDLGVI